MNGRATDPIALYSRRLRELAAMVRADRRLVPVDRSATRISLTCGSSVTLDVRCRGDRIEALGYRTRACLLGMAATAIVVAQAPGCSFDDVAAIATRLRDLLQGSDAEFPEPWRELVLFEAARPLRARHDAILLPFDALAEAIGV